MIDPQVRHVQIDIPGYLEQKLELFPITNYVGAIKSTRNTQNKPLHWPQDGKICILWKVDSAQDISRIKKSFAIKIKWLDKWSAWMCFANFLQQTVQIKALITRENTAPLQSHFIQSHLFHPSGARGEVSPREDLLPLHAHR